MTPCVSPAPDAAPRRATEDSVPVRLEAAEHAEMAASAAAAGFASVADYLRHLHARGRSDPALAPARRAPRPPGAVEVYHRTRLGAMYRGDSRGYLFGVAAERGVDLIVTSPPFALVRKKAYGNEDADAYCEWFRPFAEGFRRVLKESGSLVIDIGGAWRPGRPTRSLYHFKLLLMLCEDYGFHLAQEHYWWNPAKLPAPAEWVNVRRVRVKDAVNPVWWLSPTPWPKACNRRVLAPYSESMRGLLRDGHRPEVRPSGHAISEKFGRDNGGSVPPNLLAIANTESGGRYQRLCRERGIAPHPARFPPGLPEYFIRMLTDPGDLVLDPFGGSCVTGAVAESLGRRWACVELVEDYLRGALGRFEGDPRPAAPRAAYTLHAPCALAADEAQAPLASDGGRARSGGVDPAPADAADAAGAARALRAGGLPVSAIAAAARVERRAVYAWLDGCLDGAHGEPLERLGVLHGLLRHEAPGALRWFHRYRGRPLAGGETLDGLLGAECLDPARIRAALDALRPAVAGAMDRDRKRAKTAPGDGPPGLLSLGLSVGVTGATGR